MRNQGCGIACRTELVPIMGHLLPVPFLPHFSFYLRGCALCHQSSRLSEPAVTCGLFCGLLGSSGQFGQSYGNQWGLG
eukprot:5439750-Pyramimonas_sp.AAC.1